MRLLCFAFAGGGASTFRSWSLPQVDICPIQLPGRENRFKEVPITNMDLLAETLVAQLPLPDDLPIAFFGHSLGAFIAYEMMKRLGGTALFVSACPAPHIARNGSPMHTLPGPEFLAAVKAMDGIPPVIRENSDLLSFFAPVLRADLKLYETYRPSKPAKLRGPVIAFGGESDALVTSRQLEHWGDICLDFQMRFFPGGHFFLRDSESQVLALIHHEIMGKRSR